MNDVDPEFAASSASRRAPSRPRPPRDQGTTRNPVVSRMSAATSAAWCDAVSTQVAQARDRFHTLVRGALTHGYKRPPIYLVDDWLVDVLGAFVSGGTAPVGPGGRSGRGSSKEPDPWLHALMRLFGHLQPVVDALSRAWLLELRKDAAAIEEAAVGLAVATVRDDGVDEAFSALREALAVARDVPETALRALERESEVAPRLRRQVVSALRQRVDAATHAAERLARLRPRRAVQQVGVVPGHPGGLLGEGLEALNIEAPAVILAPRRIERWSRTLAQEVPSLHEAIVREERQAGRREREPSLWRQPAQLSLAFRLALTNVTAHELTHVLVRLPSVSGRAVTREADEARDALYRHDPGVEEGAANFLGGLATLHEVGELLDAHAGYPVEGRAGRARRGADWQRLWHQHQDLVEATVGDYHRGASLAWLKGWQGTERELSALAGVFNVLALNPSATDWGRTMGELEEGIVSLTRGA